MTASFSAKLSADTITQPQFLQLATFVLARTSMAKWEAMPHILLALGLGTMKLPNIPLDPQVALLAPAANYCKTEVMPFLSAHIKAFLEDNADHEDVNVAVIQAIQKDIADGLTEAESEHPVVKNWAESISMIPAAQLAPEFKTNVSDKTIEPKLLSFFVIITFLTQLFTIDTQAAVPVVKKWGIDLQIASPEAPDTLDESDKLD